MEDFSAAPFFLSGARVWRTYLGGRLLDRQSGILPGKDGHYPEEWMFSAVHAVNPGEERPEEGLCALRDYPDILFRRLLSEQPEKLLGTEHARKYGATPGMLIKLIDSAERLTVQVHPDKEKAKKLFGSPFGKTESWHILGTRSDGEKPCIYLGFREGVTRKAWKECFEKQDSAAMLGMLHRFDVKPGETYLVKGGVPHAVGSGCFLVETQEPTDYTIRVERVTPSGLPVEDRLCHQGLGFEKMFDCFSYEGVSRGQAENRWKLAPTGTGFERHLIRPEDTPCFSLDLWQTESPRDQSSDGTFRALYVLSGRGALQWEGKEHPLHAGDQVFVPAASVPYRLEPDPGETLRLLCFHGPK